MREMTIDIVGLGFILYSPPAVREIPEGCDYLGHHFSRDEDVARHVVECQLTAFCTGSPGTFRIRFLEGVRNENAVENAEYKLRLGLQVHESVLCVRDLYDLMQWSAGCPAEQQIALEDGWYLLTVMSSPPESGVLGDNQIIDIHLQPTVEKPLLSWDGVPTLCD